MSNLVANTVMVTTKCSGGCSHCPFSNPSLEKLFLPPETIVKMINQSTKKLVILSGGEPFEHPKILEILNNLFEAAIPFRIATGGFIKLDPWIDKLKALSMQNIAFNGISMGTDVLSDRVNHSDWVSSWERNIHLLIKEQIPFSLTITINAEFQLNRFAFFSWREIFKRLPEFIYLRYSNDCLKYIWIEKIKGVFGKTPIILDNISATIHEQ